MAAASPKPLRTMFAPAAASASAMPWPMPLVEPVTRAVFPFSMVSVLWFLASSTGRSLQRRFQDGKQQRQRHHRKRGRDQHCRSRAAEVEIVLARSEEHTSELQSLMRNSYAVFCLKQKQ